MKMFPTSYRVIYGDVDAMQMAYYANYLRWFEIGRSELIRHLGLPYAGIETMGFLLPVTEAFCKYIKPARYDEIILIHTGVGFLRRASLRFEYRIVNQENDLLAQGHTIHACLDRAGKLVRLPERVFDLLRNWGY
jgi:acyl-CoA thioester hydrolase